MKVELRKLSEIKPYENNPPQNDAAVDAVAASIREFGFRQPIVVDEKGVIVVGHTRYKAAITLGLEKVPVHVARGLTPEQIKAYRIADNKTADLAAWDLDLLPQELAELDAAGFDLSLIGFSEEELARLLSEDLTDGPARHTTPMVLAICLVPRFGRTALAHPIEKYNESQLNAVNESLRLLSPHR